MLQLYLSDQQFYCLLRSVLYNRFDGTCWNCSQVNATEHLWWYVSIGSGNGLGAIRQQAIAWANVDPDLSCHIVHIGHVTLAAIAWTRILVPYLCRSFQSNSFQDWTPVDFICKYPIFKWVAQTLLHDRAPGQQAQQWLMGDMPSSAANKYLFKIYYFVKY